MMQLNAKASLLLAMCDAILATVAAADPVIGAPGGHIYAALMHVGLTLDQFEQVMALLVKVGKVRKSGQCYFPV